jgi:hypothetical protein
MNITQKLQDFTLTFDAYLELDADGFIAESEDLKGFWTEYADEFTDDQSDLYEIAFALEQDAAMYFEEELKQAERDQLADEIRYFGSRHLC